MFDTGVAFGERIVLLHRVPLVPPVPCRVLVPGVGVSTRDRARSAVLRPEPSAPISHGPGRARKRVGGRTLLTAPDSRTPEILLPGQLDRVSAVRAECLGVDPLPVDAAMARRLGLRGSDAGLRRYELWGDWGYWQQRVHVLAESAPGSELAALLEERPQLADVPCGTDVPGGLGSLRAQLRLDSLAARQQLIAALQGDQYADAAALAVEYPANQEFLSAEVALSLAMTESAASGLLATAFTLATKLPRTLEALQAGKISIGVAEVMVGATACVTDLDVASVIEKRVLPRAAGRSRESVRRDICRQVIRLDPHGEEARHKIARAERRISRWAGVEGMGWLKVHAPVQDIAAAWEAVTGLADAAKSPGDERSMGERRVDAFADIFHSILDRGGWDDTVLPTQHGRRPHVEVLIPYSLLHDPVTAAAEDHRTASEKCKRCSDASRQTDADVPAESDTDGSRKKCRGDAGLIPPTADRPNSDGTVEHPSQLGEAVGAGFGGVCELVGYGPITLAQALAIAGEGVWRRLVCDPLSGTLLDYGRTRYEPPDSLKQFVTTRDQVCSFFGCNQPAWRSQIDHVQPFSTGRPHRRGQSRFRLSAPSSSERWWGLDVGDPPRSIQDVDESTRPKQDHTGHAAHRFDGRGPCPAVLRQDGAPVISLDHPTRPDTFCW